jgi:cytochrome c-type biogenesis protein CcmF
MPSPATIGQFALIAALLLAIIQTTVPLFGAARGKSSWIAIARPAGQWQFVAVSIAF